MSYSPDIDVKGYTFANIYAYSNYSETNPPIPGYSVFLNTLLSAGEVSSTEIDFTSTPLIFPTLENLAATTEQFQLILDPITGATDYARLFLAAIMNRMPPHSLETSGFFDWNKGFGFGIQAQVYLYDHGGPGESDIYDRQAYIRADQPPREYMKVNYNCEDTATYYATRLNTTPHQTFYAQADFYAQPSYQASGDSVEFGLTQVLYRTRFLPLTPDRRVIQDSSMQSFINTNMIPTSAEKEVSNYPKVTSVSSTSDGFTGDLRLFEGLITHNYGTYDYVRQDIRQRFKYPSQIQTHRDEYVSDRIQHFTNLLGSTFKVPKGFRTKKQVSPRVMQVHYSTFQETSSQAPVTATSTGTSTGDGGSY